MRRTYVEAQIAPAAAHVVAARVGAVEAKQKQRILHHVLRLEGYRQPRILEGNFLGGVRCIRLICALGKDDGRLWLLQS